MSFRGGWIVPASVSALCFGPLGASPVLNSAFGDGDQAVAFVVAGGREVVSLGVAGMDLRRARLVGAGGPVEESVADPVSRLVVFRSRQGLGAGLALAATAPRGGALKDARDGGACLIEDRVQEVGGRFLPFTLLRLSAEGAVPQPGTPLLDPGGRVAAVAHQPAGGQAFYALPIEVVRRVLEDSRNGAVSKAWVGLVLNPETRGTRVERVVPDSPAAEAGLRAGDVLREIDGKRLDGYGDAVNAFFLMRADRPVKVRVLRGSGELALELIPSVGAL